MRNRRGEFIITELNPEILLQQIPEILLQQISENNCSVGQVVEFIISEYNGTYNTWG